MNFVYSLNKSASNKKKHGIDFEEVKALWADPEALQGEAKVVEDEHRWYRIGTIGNRAFTVIFTIRGEVIRLISARPAHEREREAYERKKTEGT